MIEAPVVMATGRPMGPSAMQKARAHQRGLFVD
jgi:hypothetical protein